MSEDHKKTEAGKQTEKDLDELKNAEKGTGDETITPVDEELVKLQTELELKDAQIAGLKSEFEESKNQLLRKVAEFENMRKRV
ncbi:MAG: hypothetical protein WCB49_00055, partial [Gammaproteobacteria bacterium]